jgi:lactate 2-monooxygenase
MVRLSLSIVSPGCVNLTSDYLGGRQVDGAISTLDALELVMRSTRVREAQASGKFTILFDSGIRTGPDILKAMALGAQAVLSGLPLHYFGSNTLESDGRKRWVVGRSYVSGLALDGEAGVEAVVKYLLSDLSLSMGLSGYKNLKDVQSTLASNMIRKT